MAARLEGLLSLKQKNIEFDRHYERGLYPCLFRAFQLSGGLLQFDAVQELAAILKFNNKTTDHLKRKALMEDR